MLAVKLSCRRVKMFSGATSYKHNCVSIFGGLCYKFSKKLPLAYIGELFGTGIIGALAAYPIAVYVMGKEAALFAYVLPFIISSAGGTVIAIFLVTALKQTHALDKFFGDEQ